MLESIDGRLRDAKMSDEFADSRLASIEHQLKSYLFDVSDRVREIEASDRLADSRLMSIEHHLRNYLFDLPDRLKSIDERLAHEQPHVLYVDNPWPRSQQNVRYARPPGVRH